MKFRFFLCIVLFSLGTHASFSQTIYGDLYLHSVQTYPKYFSPEGKRSYSVTVEAENGAEAYWDINTNGLVKNYLALDGLSLTDANAAFKVTVKLYRKTDTATPLQYGITDEKGNILLLVAKDDPRFTIPAGVLYGEHMNRVLNNMSQEIKEAIDFGAVRIPLSSYNLRKDKPENKEYTDIQKAVNSSFFYFAFAPGKVSQFSSVKDAEAFWKKQYYATPKEDKKVKNIRLLNAYNLSSIYTYDGNLDSAVIWLEKARQETNSTNNYFNDLDRFVAFQTKNIANYQASKSIFKDLSYSPDTKKNNMAIATSRSFAPKEGEGFKERNPNAASGAIYKNGKRTDGEFVPLPGKAFDPSFIRFVAKGEKAVKLVTPFFADSIVIGEHHFQAVGDKFGKLIFDSPKIKVLHEVAPAGQDCCNIYHFVRKTSNRTDSYYIGQTKFSKFIAKYFSDCPKLIEIQLSGGFDTISTKAATLKAAADYTQNCN